LLGEKKLEIADKLRYYRKLRGLTQKQLADKVGVQNTAVSAWENGINSIDADYLSAICIALDITANDLFGDATEQKNTPSPEGERTDQDELVRRFLNTSNEVRAILAIVASLSEEQKVRALEYAEMLLALQKQKEQQRE